MLTCLAALVAVQGAADKALDYFSKLGFECPLHENPANHLMDVITRGL